MLSEKEKAVVETITMRFHGSEALIYLKKVGMEMGLSTYYRYRRKVEDMKLERMQFIADHFQELHLEKIDRLELIDRLMWQEYEKAIQPYRRVKILETIANAQANVSSYYETSTIALEVSAKFSCHDNGKKNDNDPMSFEEWTKNNTQPRVSDDSHYSEEENGQYYWGLHKKYKAYLKDWENQNFGPDSQVWGIRA